MPFPSRKAKAVPPDIKQFFSQARALRHVSMAGTKLPPDAVRSGMGIGACQGGGFGVDLVRVLSPGALQGSWMGLQGAEPMLPMLMGGFGVFSRAMLQGLAYNSHVSDLHLDLSSCEVREGHPRVPWVRVTVPTAGSHWWGSPCTNVLLFAPS